jgi:hypothetical protein
MPVNKPGKAEKSACFNKKEVHTVQMLLISALRVAIGEIETGGNEVWL